MHAALQHVHRSASHGTCRHLDAVLDRKKRFGIFRGNSEDACQPHPEYRAGSTRSDGGRHTDDVSRTDCRRECCGQRTELTHIPLTFLVRTEGEFDCLADVALNEAKAQCQEHMRTEQKDEQWRTPGDVAEVSQEVFEFCHEDGFLFQ